MRRFLAKVPKFSFFEMLVALGWRCSSRLFIKAGEQQKCKRAGWCRKHLPNIWSLKVDFRAGWSGDVVHRENFSRGNCDATH
jgi:hypothetical protein